MVRSGLWFSSAWGWRWNWDTWRYQGNRYWKQYRTERRSGNYCSQRSGLQAVSAHWCCFGAAKICKARQHCHHGLSHLQQGWCKAGVDGESSMPKTALSYCFTFCSTYKVEKTGGSFTGLNNWISRGLPGTAVWHIHHAYHNYSSSCTGGHRRTTVLLRSAHDFKVHCFKETLLMPWAFIF